MHGTKHALLTFAALVGLTGGAAILDTASGRQTARAETVEASRSADVFATPGEQSRVVTRVRAGKEMTVLGSKNRWLKVRVNGRTGWITRTNTRSVALSEAAPRTKRKKPFVEGRSTRRGFRGKAPADRVGADATDESFIEDDEGRMSARERRRAAAKRKRAQAREQRNVRDEEIDEDELDEAEDEELLDDEEIADEEEADSSETVVVKVARLQLREEPSARSERIDSVRKGARLLVIERDGDWIMVESEGGETGWVKSSAVESGSSGGGATYAREKFAKRASAGLGYAVLGQTFASDGMDPRSNYRISSGAAVIGLGGEGIYDYSKKFLLGGDLAYRFHYASPGIRYSYDGESANIGFKTHQLDIGALGGYKLPGSSGMAAFARLGYHYERFGVDNVEDFTQNLAYLPSEILQGVTVGGMFDAPMITDKIAARAGIDALVIGSRAQTLGLQDGADSSAFALWLSAGVQYAFRPNLKFTGGYQLAYSKTTWTGVAEGSMRPHAADSTGAQRSDTAHLFSVGVGRSF